MPWPQFWSTIIRNQANRYWLSVLIIALASSLFPTVRLSAQDARELEQERAASKKLKGEHPLIELMRTRRSALRTELMGVHPRVYVTDKELAELRVRARTSHRELWQRAISHVRALAADPPPPPAEQRRQQNDVGIAIAEAAFVYKIEGDQKYLDAATEKVLRQAVELRQQVAGIDEQIQRLEKERDALHKEQQRIRENLLALGDRPSEKELRERFVRTLNTQEDRLEQLVKEINANVESAARCREQLHALLDGLEYEAQL